MFGIGPAELLVVFLIILVLFGAKRLPELAKSLGRSIMEFKNATQNIKDELDFTKIDDTQPVKQNRRPQSEAVQEQSKEEKPKKEDEIAG